MHRKRVDALPACIARFSSGSLFIAPEIQRMPYSKFKRQIISTFLDIPGHTTTTTNHAPRRFSKHTRNRADFTRAFDPLCQSLERSTLSTPPTCYVQKQSLRHYSTHMKYTNHPAPRPDFVPSGPTADESASAVLSTADSNSAKKVLAACLSSPRTRGILAVLWTLPLFQSTVQVLCSALELPGRSRGNSIRRAAFVHHFNDSAYTHLGLDTTCRVRCRLIPRAERGARNNGRRIW